VKAKLEREAVEDFRIDFEDGFGNRSDEEEDATAVTAAAELAKGMQAGSISPFIGIRIKPFTEDLKYRGIRTLDIFVSTLLEASGGKLPDNFVVMLPKVTIPEQMEALVQLFDGRQQQVFLGGEVPVQRARRHVNGTRELSHGGGENAAPRGTPVRSYGFLAAADLDSLTPHAHTFFAI
jgi:hypothetical protein